MPLHPHQQRLRDGQTVVAVNIGGRNPDVMGVLARGGAHIAFVDCERTGIGLDAATDLIRAARVAGLSPMVRSWSRDPAVLVQYLDREADGLIIPHIDTAAQAADAVEVVRYACGEQARDKSVIVQIETGLAVENIDDILGVAGIDAFLIGPNDLAYSLTGRRGVTTPEVTAAIDTVSARLRAAGLRFGMPANWQQLAQFQGRGATLLYFPIEWLLERSLAELGTQLGIR
jgi:2-keto-3-deoxy-L-rhamnonate aldolase RhmA